MEHLNATVAIYDNHQNALAAIKILTDSEFPVDKISIVGKGDIVEDHFKIHDSGEYTQKGLAVGAVIGGILGVLTGLSFFALPGLGVLFASGALIGGTGGVAMGAAGGGIFSTLLSLGISKSGVLSYKTHLENGKFLVICHGTQEEIDNAKLIIEEKTSHVGVESHN